MGNIQKCFFPHGEVAVDEQLFPCTSRCAFIQYVPQKPSKFGIKFWMLCDVKTSYALRATPYLGKEDRPDDVGVADHVVLTLMDPYHKTSLNVTTDNFFMSIKTAKKLLEHDITMVGTLRINKKRNTKGTAARLTQAIYCIHSSRSLLSRDDRIMIAFYKAKQKKNVLLLSSMHMSSSVDETDAKKRPEFVMYYIEPKTKTRIRATYSYELYNDKNTF